MYSYDDHINEEMTYKDTTLYFKPYLTNTSYHNNYRQRNLEEYIICTQNLSKKNINVTLQGFIGKCCVELTAVVF